MNGTSLLLFNGSEGVSGFIRQWGTAKPEGFSPKTKNKCLKINFGLPTKIISSWFKFHNYKNLYWKHILFYIKVFRSVYDKNNINIIKL